MSFRAARPPRRRQERQGLGSRRAQAAHRSHAAEGRTAPGSRRARLPPPAGSNASSTPSGRSRRIPGNKALARLNRTEYANAIRDLLAYDPERSSRRCRPTSPSAASTTSPRRSTSRPRCSKAMRKRPCRSAAARWAISRWATARCATRPRAAAAQRRHIEGLAARHARRHRRRAHVSARRRVRVHRQAFLPARGLGQPDGRSSCGATARASTSRSTARRSSSTSAGGFACACPRVRSASRPRSWTSKRCAGVNELYLGEVELGGAIAGVDDRRPVRRDGRRRHAEPPRDLRLQPGLGLPTSAVRGDARSRGSRRAPIAIRLADGSAELASSDGVLRTRAQRRRRLRGRHSIRAVAPARRPALSVSIRERAEGRRGRRRLSHRRSRARVASLVLSLEQHPGRRAARGGRRRAAARSRRCSPRRSSACSPIARVAAVRRELRRPVAEASRARRFPVAGPELDADLRAAFRRETELFVRGRAARDGAAC